MRKKKNSNRPYLQHQLVLSLALSTKSLPSARTLLCEIRKKKRATRGVQRPFSLHLLATTTHLALFSFFKPTKRKKNPTWTLGKLET